MAMAITMVLVLAAYRHPNMTTEMRRLFSTCVTMLVDDAAVCLPYLNSVPSTLHVAQDVHDQIYGKVPRLTQAPTFPSPLSLDEQGG
jgi:hypothetical protein